MLRPMSGGSQSIANIQLDMRLVPDHICVVYLSNRNKEESRKNFRF